jgi:hypothetical protein
MERVADIIDGLGGNSVVSREMGIKPSAVSEMKRRNSIPPKYWLGLIRLSRSLGKRQITADELVAVHALADGVGSHDASAPAKDGNHDCAFGTACPVRSSDRPAHESVA